MGDTEKNLSWQTENYVAAQRIKDRINEIDKTGNYTGHARFLEGVTAHNWEAEAFDGILSFIDAEGRAIFIARFPDDERTLDESGRVDACYRITYGGETKDVLIPAEIGGPIVHDMRTAGQRLYDWDDDGMLDALNRYGDGEFLDGAWWLQWTFGDSLAITPAGREDRRLEADGKPIAVSLDVFLPFDEGDF